MSERLKQMLGERQLLLLILIMAVFFHFASLTFLAIRKVGDTTPKSAAPRIRWMADPSDEAVASLSPSSRTVADLLDPSLSVLPNPNGFSRQMWERAATATRQPLQFNATPAYLEP